MQRAADGRPLFVMTLCNWLPSAISGHAITPVYDQYRNLLQLVLGEHGRKAILKSPIN